MCGRPVFCFIRVPFPNTEALPYFCLSLKQMNYEKLLFNSSADVLGGSLMRQKGS